MPDLNEIFKNCVKNVAENIIKNRASGENTSGSEQKTNAASEDTKGKDKKDEKDEKERQKYSDPFVDSNMKMIEEYAKKVDMVSKKLFDEFLKKIMEQFNQETSNEKTATNSSSSKDSSPSPSNKGGLSAPKSSLNFEEAKELLLKAAKHFDSKLLEDLAKSPEFKKGFEAFEKFAKDNPKLVEKGVEAISTILKMK